MWNSGLPGTRGAIGVHVRQRSWLQTRGRYVGLWCHYVHTVVWSTTILASETDADAAHDNAGKLHIWQSRMGRH